MQGPPGAGKSLLARSLPSILPNLSFEESLEVTKIYSVAGFLPKEKPLINLRPFRSPHHTTSETALIGGGNPPKPGEITFIKGKPGGVFIALKKEMIKRAEKLIKKK